MRSTSIVREQEILGGVINLFYFLTTTVEETDGFQPAQAVEEIAAQAASEPESCGGWHRRHPGPPAP